MKRTGWESRSVTGFSRVLSARLTGELVPMVPFFPDPHSTRPQNQFHPAPLKTAELCYGFLNHFKSGTHYFRCYFYSTFGFPPELLLLLISELPFSTLKKKKKAVKWTEKAEYNHLILDQASAVSTLSQKTFIWVKALWMGLLLPLL